MFFYQEIAPLKQILCRLSIIVPNDRVEANDGNNTGNGKFAHPAASSRT